MPVAANDIIQLTVEGRKDAQAILNMFCYRVAAAPSSGTVADNIDALIAELWDDPGGTWIAPWLNMMPLDYTLRAVRGQRLAPTRSAYVEELIQTVGLIEGNLLETANLSWVFIKQSETAGRWAQSPTHMLMPSQDWFTNGELNAFGAAARATFLALVPQIVAPGDGGSYEPVIFNPGRIPNFVKITHVTTKQEVRVMRRRTVGLGI